MDLLEDDAIEPQPLLGVVVRAVEEEGEDVALVYGASEISADSVLRPAEEAEYVEDSRRLTLLSGQVCGQFNGAQGGPYPHNYQLLYNRLTRGIRHTPRFALIC